MNHIITFNKITQNKVVFLASNTMEANMNIFEYIERNKKLIVGIITVLLIIPLVFQLFLSALPLNERFIYVFWSGLFLLTGFSIIYFPLGLQVHLKVLSKK